MCDHKCCFRPVREIEVQLVEECGLSDLNIVDAELDGVSGLLVFTVENLAEEDIPKLERQGWMIEENV